jgi:Xaa-Pro aminopeptidase
MKSLNARDKARWGTLGGMILLGLAAIVRPAAAGDDYSARRAACLAKIGPGLAVVPAQFTGARGPQDNKDFYYLTGSAEPEAVLVLGGDGEARETYFNRTGKGMGTAPLGAISVRPLTELRSFLSRAASGKNIYLSLANLDGLSSMIGGSAVLGGATGLLPLDPIIAEMRMIKSADEIAVLQKAIDLTTEAYLEVLKAVQPGMKETDLNAIIEYTYLRRGGTSSFTQVASGPNSVNIHFGASGREMKAGDVIVFDLGMWLDKNTSDISRTIPVGGRFTKEQAEIYDLVLRSEKAAIALMTPGTVAIKPQEAAENVLMEGLVKLGLATDPASPWQRRFYIQHGFGHGIGLDVHDVWGWWSRRMRTDTLKPGMVLTMEPGLYFPAERIEQVPGPIKSMISEDEWKAFAAQVGPVYKKYAGMGCRIEDDVLITETGNRVLSDKAPKEIADLEKWMKLGSPFNQLIK